MTDRYYIESAEYGQAEGGIGCGPIDGPLVAEAAVTDENGNHFYLSLAEAWGAPNFYKSDDSLFSIHMSSDAESETLEKLNSAYIELGDYETIFTERDCEYFDLIRYLVYLVRSTDPGLDEYVKDTEGHYLDEIFIPESDIEEEIRLDSEEY